MSILVGVPVMSNFRGFAELVHSLNNAGVEFMVEDNWNENIGVSKAWNKFLKAGLKRDYDSVLICNDDVVWRPGSFGNLLSAWYSRPTDTILMSGVAHDIAPGLHEAPDYSCFIFDPQEILEYMGSFDENFSPAYFEDNDSHYRIKLADKRALCVSEARVDHKGSQTQNADPSKPVVSSQMFEANRDYYSRKWGGWPGQETFTTPFNDPNKSIKDW